MSPNAACPQGLTTAAFTMVLAAVILLFGLQFWASYRAAQRDAATDASNLADVLTSDIERTLQRTVSDLHVLANLVQPTDLSMPVKAERQELIEGTAAVLLSGFAEIAGIHVFDADGRAVYNAGYSDKAFSAADTEWFRTLIDHPDADPVFSDVIIGRLSKRPIMVLSVAVKDRQGRFIGAVSAAMDLNKLQQETDALDIGPHGLLSIRRIDNGQLLLRRPDSPPQNHAVIKGAVTERIQAGETSGSGEAAFSMDGLSRRYAFRVLKDAPIDVIVAIARSDYLMPWTQQTVTFGAIAVILLTALAILVWRQLRSEAALRERGERLRLAAAVFTNTQEGIAITDLDGTILAVNPAVAAITGYGEDELVGGNPRVLKSGRHDQAFYQSMFETVAKDGYWQGEIWNRRKNGEVYPEWLSISPVRDETGRLTNYVATFADTSRLTASESQLKHLAHHDPLTDLPNRVLLLSRLQHAVGLARRAQTCGAVLFVDLDRFKNVNDSLGHLAGDELLQMVADRYRRRLRETDTLSRLGGDEFVVLIEDLPELGHAAAVAQSLIDELRQPFLLSGGREVYVGASVGISVFPEDGAIADQIIANADAAMYQAKSQGHGSFRFYTDELTRIANARIDMEAALRRGLDRGELVLHYQPLTDTRDRRTVGVEALVRWNHPTDGMVPPARFIPLAEETGLIIPLGAWVLRTACRQMKSWLESGATLRTMAVNLSPHQFQSPGLIETVQAALAETGLPPQCLELEITEGALMEHGEEAVAKLHTLKALGVRLAIDDFGTGYSSLAYLKRFPIDKLKVDQTFVRGIPHDAADVEITSAIVALAKNLDFEVLAEGVETEEQLACLIRMGCLYCQGYLFSRPLAPAQFELDCLAHNGVSAMLTEEQL